MNSELLSSAVAGGYSENLIKFLGFVSFTWNEQLTVDAVKAGMPEREVLICALQHDFGESADSRRDAEERYRQNCDAAGNFRYARFFKKKRNYPTAPLWACLIDILLTFRRRKARQNHSTGIPAGCFRRQENRRSSMAPLFRL